MRIAHDDVCVVGRAGDVDAVVLHDGVLGEVETERVFVVVVGGGAAAARIVGTGWWWSIGIGIMMGIIVE